MKNTQSLCEAYLQALNEADLEGVLALFEPDGVVVSPIYGRLPASTFYPQLFADTNRSVTTLKRIYASTDQHLALDFEYQWTLKNGHRVDFLCVDLFELNEAADKLKAITIVYDTVQARQEFD